MAATPKGRTRRYRYYTCFTRTRYGKHATCTAPRLPADELDRMILRALHDFYTTAEPVLAAMIERAQAQRDSTADDRRAELTATANQITHTENAITCYHTAFENGTMDDATAGPRIRSANGSPNSRPGTPNSTPTRPPSPRPAARHRRPHPRPPRHHSGERHHHRAQGRHRDTHCRSSTHRPGSRTRVQDSHRHDNAPARNGRGHLERATGSHNGAVGGPPGTRTLNPSGVVWIVSHRADRGADLGDVWCRLTTIDSSCRRHLCPRCAR
ncbi:zinc ribbon domain-containing protein [Micromonospora sp. WMMC415]|uniref:zinc ribbon domain-containing protein n=1 Tax=Micromonospora sp. WMMC415 TaxID=2675222 RepID=UPI0018AFDC3B